MKDEEPRTYITYPIEIAAHIDTLVNKRIRGDLKILDEGEVVRVIFLGHGGDGGGAYILLERLVAIGTLNRLDISKDVSVEYIEDGVGFFFESRSIDIEDRDGCIRLSFPKRLVKSQKRRFFRMRPLPTPPIFEVIVNTETVSVKCPVNDISAGGLAFISGLDNELLTPGMIVTLEFCLLDGFVVKAGGIVRSLSIVESSLPKGKYRCGVEFVGIPESIQDRIVRFIFNLQKEELKRRRER